MGGSNVPSVEERVIEIVCENLGVNKEQVQRKTSFIDQAQRKRGSSLVG